MIFILSLLFLIQSIVGVPVPRVITRWHTADAVTSTLTYTTGTTTVWLPPVQVLISGDCTTTFTITTGQWATTPVTTTSYAAGQQDGDDQPEPTHTDNAQQSPPAATTEANTPAETPAAETPAATTAAETAANTASPDAPVTSTSATTSPQPTDSSDNNSGNDSGDNSDDNAGNNNSGSTENTGNNNNGSSDSNNTSNTSSASNNNGSDNSNSSSNNNNAQSSVSTAAPSTSSFAPSSTADSTTLSSQFSSSSSSTPTGENSLKISSQGGYKFSLALNKLTRPDVIVYSPYGNDGSCKTHDEVETDLKFLKQTGFNKIRTYGVDCNIISAVLPLASSLGFKVNQGFWISNQGVDSIDDSVSNLIDYAKKNSWDVFDYLTIGNEAIIEGYATPSQLISKINSVKKKLQANGYNGKVTTSEPPVMYKRHPELCTEAEIDFVGINSHSYFNTNLHADEAGEYVASQQKEIAKICSKKAVITETGYPSKGIKNGNNIPSLANQYAAIKSIMDATNGDCTILSSFDDFWKNPGPYGIEQAFGVIGFF